MAVDRAFPKRTKRPIVIQCRSQSMARKCAVRASCNWSNNPYRHSQKTAHNQCRMLAVPHNKRLEYRRTVSLIVTLRDSAVHTAGKVVSCSLFSKSSCEGLMARTISQYMESNGLLTRVICSAWALRVADRPLHPDYRLTPLLFTLLDAVVVGNRNTVLFGKGHHFSA